MAPDGPTFEGPTFEGPSSEGPTSEGTPFSSLQAEWARLLIGSLADAGVRDVVISPGSRSTPLVLAAAAHPGLECFDLIDERSAAYFALGQARVTGRPSLLIATSGTAGANYFPAVVEAGVAHVPLLVLTADRPVELVGCGANQTIDQQGLFGRHAREFFDLGTPNGSPRALRALRRQAAQAVLASGSPKPGAVHLNARLAKPLEPGEGESEADQELTQRVDELLRRGAPRARVARRLPAAEDIVELAKACRSNERGLIVCGPAPLAQATSRSLIAELGRRTGFPILREATSQARYCPELDDVATCDAFGPLLANEGFRQRAMPRLVIQIGRGPTAASWKQLVAGVPKHWVLSPDGWYDAESTASDLVFADLEPTLALLTSRLPATPRSGPWAALWTRAERAVQRAIDEELEAAAPELTEGAAARHLASTLPAGSLLAVGNSLPIRGIDVYGRGATGDLRVWCQRGASGIDGVVSGVFGAASRWRHRVALLIGDVSFLHDLSGLQAARCVGVPVILVVVQNQGGRIFEQLPLAQHPAGKDVMEHWTTPHQLDLSHAAELHGLSYERVERVDALDQALANAYSLPGVTLIEAVVPPHGAAEQAQRLRERVASALQAEDEA
ncbi:MAG: 2-succinyl-5-enolpyruvyl-6-hydroxy-3-cyclohexene-1-carboxylic-acid synthase [Acidobacteriota bacterium]